MTLFMCVFVLSWGFELQDFRIGSAVGGMTSHREGGLIAVSSDDWIVRIIDSESRSVVREVRGFVFCFIIFLIRKKSLLVIPIKSRPCVSVETASGW